MNYKYTLSCKPGKMCSPGLHYLRIGSWDYPEGEIILTHGYMSESEYRDIVSYGGCYLYTCEHLNWVGIYRWHIQRKDSDKSHGAIGFLRYIGYNKYCGHVHLNDIL